MQRSLRCIDCKYLIYKKNETSKIYYCLKYSKYRTLATVKKVNDKNFICFVENDEEDDENKNK